MMNCPHHPAAAAVAPCSRHRQTQSILRVESRCCHAALVSVILVRRSSTTTLPQQQQQQQCWPDRRQFTCRPAGWTSVDWNHVRAAAAAAAAAGGDGGGTRCRRLDVADEWRGTGGSWRAGLEVR